MRTYVTVTGIIFIMLTLAHVWRAFVETTLIRDPFFIVVTIISTTLAVWAFRLLAQLRRASA